MTRDAIFGPVIAQMALSLGLYVMLIRARVRAFRMKQVDKARFALHQDAWPEQAIQIGNNVHSQFELPVLFYATAFALWALHAVHAVALVAAWLFVASRLVHSWIHIGSNFVPARFRAFVAGFAMVIVLALLVAWELGRRAVGLGPF